MEELNKNKTMSNLTKNNLKKLSIPEARGWIIEKFLYIEHKINKHIMSFYEPKELTHFENIMLNSSILDIGSKIKILSNIPEFETKLIENIRNLSSIRNGFAHAKFSHHVTVNIGVDSSTVSDKKTIISVMNSQGKIKEKIAYDYLIEFKNIFDDLKDKL